MKLTIPMRTTRREPSFRPTLCLVAPLGLAMLAACVAPPVNSPQTPSASIATRRISVVDDRGRERIVLDGERGVLLLDARGRPAAKLRVIDVGVAPAAPTASCPETRAPGAVCEES